MNIRIPQSGAAAKLAKNYLQSQGLVASHQQCLELVARLHGYQDWQAMQADDRFAEKPVLRPVSSNEYELDAKADSATVIIGNIRAYLKRNDEGVSADLFPTADDSQSLAGTWLTFAEAAGDEGAPPQDSGAGQRGGPATVYVQYDKQRDAWYWSLHLVQTLAPESVLSPTFEGTREKDWAGPFLGHEDLIDALNRRFEASYEVNWIRSDAPTEAQCNLFQDNGDYQEGVPLADALDRARNLRDAGAGGAWTAETEDGELIAIFR